MMVSLRLALVLFASALFGISAFAQELPNPKFGGRPTRSIPSIRGWRPRATRGSHRAHQVQSIGNSEPIM